MDWLTEALNSADGYLTGPTQWIGLGQMVLKIMAIIILAYAFKNIGYRVLDGVLKDKKHISLNNKSDGKREQTLNNLGKSNLTYFIMLLVIMIILDIFSVPIRTMVAGAGVAGIAIGFGGQNLISDVIAGFFIIFENQFSVGDYIEIGEIEGDVVMIGMR